MYNILYTLTGALCIYFSCVNFLPTKLTAAQRAVLLSFIFGAFYTFGDVAGQFITFAVCGGVMLLLCFFTTNKLLNISYYLFGYLYIVAFNYLCMWIASFILQMDFQEIAKHDDLFIGFSVIYCIICYISTKFFGDFLTRKTVDLNFLEAKHLQKEIISVLIISTIFFILNFSYGERLGYNYSVITLNGLLFILLFFVITRLMYSVYKAGEISQALKYDIEAFENYKDHQIQMADERENIRILKHDHANIFQGFLALLEIEDVVGMKAYYKKHIAPIDQAIAAYDIKYAKLDAINNIAIIGLLSSKFTKAAKEEIKTEIGLIEPIDDLAIDSVDLLQILGGLLDNAIQAAADADIKELVFHAYFCEREQVFIFTIKNTTMPLLYTLSEIKRINVSTKGKGRGLGLYIINSKIEKLSYVNLKTTYEAPYFCQELIIKKSGDI